ncbi:MAG: hypothetical protein MK188_14410 [Gammaproteobacteria bacterium]|nr:hypothetical protein [Gammaproteobacteria bacterium]
MTDQELLKNAPKDWTHVSTSMIDTPPTWLRYEVAGVYSVWMDDNGTNPNPFWREMPNNCIEFPEFIRSRNDIEQLAKANERVEFLRGKLTLLDNAVYNPVFPDDMAQRECRKIFDCELKDSIKKFTLGKKIEVFNEWLYEVKYMEGVSARDLVDSAVEFSEQLRKEQE